MGTEACLHTITLVKMPHIQMVSYKYINERKHSCFVPQGSSENLQTDWSVPAAVIWGRANVPQETGVTSNVLGTRISV